MKKAVHQNIAAWYAANGRDDLPWRNTDDSYHIYLSEVMLQQTQVKTVLERFYFPFLEKFPSLKLLGDASLDEVLKMWEGLGYYTRAKNLHQTARITGGRLPETIGELLKLPGIGENTAHAVAAFAFRQSVPVMEANVKRILCRIHTLENPSHKLLWKAAYDLLDNDNPYDYNQAMMDIGSMVCLAKNPLCGSCPLETICKGKKEPHRYPLKKKRNIPLREEKILIHHHAGRLAMIQRKERFLHGLWGFPSTETLPDGAVYIGSVAHQYTHFKLSCKIYLYTEAKYDLGGYFSLEEIDALAISKVDEKIIKVLLQSAMIIPNEAK